VPRSTRQPVSRLRWLDGARDTGADASVTGTVAAGVQAAEVLFSLICAWSAACHGARRHRLTARHRERAPRAAQNSAASGCGPGHRRPGTPGARGRKLHPVPAQRAARCRAGPAGRRRGRRHARRKRVPYRSCRPSPPCSRCALIDRTPPPSAGAGTCPPAEPNPGGPQPNLAVARLGARCTREPSDRMVQAPSSGQAGRMRWTGDANDCTRSRAAPATDPAQFGSAATGSDPTSLRCRR
jgi:hypothetical protein